MRQDFCEKSGLNPFSLAIQSHLSTRQIYIDKRLRICYTIAIMNETPISDALCHSGASPIHRHGTQPNGTITQGRFKVLPHLWYYVLSLHLSGKTADEISELTDYSRGWIYRILKDPQVVAVRQQLLAGISDEFEALYADVVQTIRDGLTSPDIKIRLESADKWLKAHGKYKGETQHITVTAEDVVFNILNQGPQ